MRVEIAVCLLTISLAMLAPESMLPVANPLKRDTPARGAGVRVEQTPGGAPARALRESLIQGGETERVEFNKRNEPGQAARGVSDDKNGDEKTGAASADFTRLQNVW